jgi:hypothetical protein
MAGVTQQLSALLGLQLEMRLGHGHALGVSNATVAENTDGVKLGESTSKCIWR